MEKIKYVNSYEKNGNKFIVLTDEYDNVYCVNTYLVLYAIEHTKKIEKKETECK